MKHNNNVLKSFFLILLLVLAVVLGKLLGTVTAGNPFLSWLGIGTSFGFAPVSINLSVLVLTFGLTMSINVAQAILLVAAILSYNAFRLHT
jgi:hypothetical protein